MTLVVLGARSASLRLGKPTARRFLATNGVTRSRTRAIGRLAWEPTSLSTMFSKRGPLDRNIRIDTVRCFSGTSKHAKEYPDHILFPMPALSPTMDSGTISSWNKEVGDEFIAGDVLCSIETDKASVDFEAQDDGVLAKILREGENAQDIPVGVPICVVVEDKDDVPAFADYVADDEGSVPSASSTETEDSSPAPGTPPSTPPSVSPAFDSSTKSPLMPSARHLAESKGLDATGLKGTGKGGRVTKGDVLQALASGVSLPALQKSEKTSSPAPDSQPVAAAQKAPPQSSPPSAPPADIPLEEINTAGTFEDVSNSKMRKVIATRLSQSKREVPHFYTSVEVELDNVMRLRKKLANDFDVKVSVNDLIIRCCALALRDVPEVNASYDPKTKKVQQQSSIDVSVAVATPTGLITPIVLNTDKLGLTEITNTVRDLAIRARDGKLQPSEYQGGTFCVSNLGMFGIDEFSAVINPPQAAILAVGGGSKRIVPSPYIDGAEEQQKPSIKTIMTARLSADRRVVDEATSALFLSAFQRYISQPELTML